ncbi:MAG: hypothetical protein M3Y79_00600 [Pseudomonadota bacterium]|nr:hypothetical protein [Pseudomonadota bacterium]
MPASSGPEKATKGRGLQRLKGCLVATAALFWQLDTTLAAEDGEDKFGATAAVGLTGEDNVFRQPGATGPQSDAYRIISAGLRLELPVSGQRFRGEAAGSDQHFDKFSELDHQAWSLRTAWLWQAGSRLDGRIGYSAESVLSSLANLRSGTQSAAPNQLRIQRFDAEGALNVGVRWRLSAGVERIEHHNNSGQFQTSDMQRDGGSATLTYQSPAGNSIGVYASYADATLPNLQSVGLLRVDNSYRQHRMGGLLQWAPAAKSRFDLRGGYVARDHRQFPQRDLSTWTGSVTYEWRPSSRVAIAAVAQRDVSEWEQVNVGYVLSRGIALRPAFSIGPRTQISLNLESSHRIYRGDVALGPVANPGTFRENLFIAGLTMDFRLTPTFGLRLFGRHEGRRASDTVPEYGAALYGLELRANF